MKILINVPDKWSKLAVSMVNAMSSDEIAESEVDEILTSMNEEPFEIDCDNIGDSETGKGLMLGLAMIAISQKMEKIEEEKRNNP